MFLFPKLQTSQVLGIESSWRPLISKKDGIPKDENCKVTASEMIVVSYNRIRAIDSRHFGVNYALYLSSKGKAVDFEI